MGRVTAVQRQIVEGGCECGAVSYRVEGPFLYAFNCHCSRCRAATGAACKPIGGAERAQLVVVEGADGLMTTGDHSGEDVRCAGCGSLLYSVVRDGAFDASRDPAGCASDPAE